MVFLKNFSQYLGFITIEKFLALLLQMTLQQPQLITEGNLKQLGVSRNPLNSRQFLKHIVRWFEKISMLPQLLMKTQIF